MQPETEAVTEVIKDYLEGMTFADEARLRLSVP